MNAIELQEQLIQYTVKICGHEEHRGYLGMSQIGKCPRRLYHEVREGTPSDEAGKLRCYKGYQMEANILGRLAMMLDLNQSGWMLTGEVGEISALGELFIGHPDGELVALDDSGRRILVEIKSTIQRKLHHIRQRARVPTRDWYQVQCYLHFGDGWERALVIYEARDTGELYVHPVPKDERVGGLCEAKARLVLDALETGAPPKCLCGRCGQPKGSECCEDNGDYRH